MVVYGEDVFSHHSAGSWVYSPTADLMTWPGFIPASHITYVVLVLFVHRRLSLLRWRARQRAPAEDATEEQIWAHWSLPEASRWSQAWAVTKGQAKGHSGSAHPLTHTFWQQPMPPEDRSTQNHAGAPAHRCWGTHPSLTHNDHFSMFKSFWLGDASG